MDVIGTDAERLFAYMREMFHGRYDHTLDLDELCGELQPLGTGFVYFNECLKELQNYTMALASGDLKVEPPKSSNMLAAPLKSLQAALRHLTWQTKRVAEGDYKQHVDFMGEFSDSFNTMIEQLSTRQKDLEREIEAGHTKTRALEQINHLLISIASDISQCILVVDRADKKLLFQNATAQRLLQSDPNFLNALTGELPEETDNTPPEPSAAGNSNAEFELVHEAGEAESVYAVRVYHLFWEGSRAVAFVANDISNVKKLTSYAYNDELTKLYNRHYGMMTLRQWISNGRAFTLCFVDIDNLKYVNDNFGHDAGDQYIVTVSQMLRKCLDDAVVCRMGGDEFILLIPRAIESDAVAHLNQIRNQLNESDAHRIFSYSISFGVLEVEENSTLTERQILSKADERMYAHKKHNKKKLRNLGSN